MTTKQTQTFWHQHITQWQSSGLTQTQYCQEHQLQTHSLSYHKCKQAKALAPKPTGFIEPYHYLNTIFKALPYAQTVEDIEALLPWHFKNINEECKPT